MQPWVQLFERHDWQLLVEPLADDPQQALNRDSELVRQVARGEQGALARIWENPRCLIATRRETRFPHFERACAQLASEGWPVYVRESGGTTVPHEPGIVHFSLAFPTTEARTFELDTIFEALCEPVRLALQKLGLDARYGFVEGSYCDGRYNLAIDGLKVTGTAQRLVGGRCEEKGIKGAVLAQAMLMVECDAVQGTDMVNRFYRLAGDGRVYDPAVSTCIAERLGPDLRRRPGELTARVRTLIAESFGELAALSV